MFVIVITCVLLLPLLDIVVVDEVQFTLPSSTVRFRSTAVAAATAALELGPVLLLLLRSSPSPSSGTAGTWVLEPAFSSPLVLLFGPATRNIRPSAPNGRRCRRCALRRVAVVLLVVVVAE
jgi:hypothetical protein